MASSTASSVKRVLALLVVAVIVASCASTGKDIHVVGGGTWALSPTAPDGMQQRVEEAATEYRQHAPVPRVAFFDIAYPASDAELADMAGYGVLLVTALSQDLDELPPKRVYVIADGREFPLELLTAARSSSQGETVSEVLGRSRWDALYLVPVYFTRDGASLAMDFAANRDGFVLGRFSSADQDRLGYGRFVGSAPTVMTPPSDAVTRLVSREFPGFLDRHGMREQIARNRPAGESGRATCPDGKSDEYYFPRNALDAGNAVSDVSRREWYSKPLATMGEPSLSCGSPGEAYRFTWLRTFHHPVAVRVQVEEGRAILHAAELDGASGFDPGAVLRHVEKPLSPADLDALRRLFDESGFNSLPAAVDRKGLDGSEWILESSGDAGYHVVVRWSPMDGPALALGQHLLSLVGWQFGDIY